MATVSETTPGSGAPRNRMELFFFNRFNKAFMERIGPVRKLLEEKYPGMLNDIINNLHSVSAHAADMILRQGLTYDELGREGQDMFMSEFMRHIDIFAERVETAFTNITPEQEQKLLQVYAKPRATDN